MSEYIMRISPDMPYEIRAELNAWYVESEPIVRCRDCMHYQENPEGTVGCRFTLITSAAHSDGFCAWGERKVAEE